MAGVIILISSVLAILANPYWLILKIAAGINLVISALTGFCLMANILVKTGFKPRCDS